MRHFATHPTGYYYLDFPTINNVNEFRVSVSNMLTENDYQVVSVEYSGNYNITQLFASTAYNMDEFGNNLPFPTNESNTHPYAAVANFQAVVNAPNGEVFWHDKTNNKVWFKVRGGLNPGDPSQPATTDENLYKGFKVRAYGEYSPLNTESFDNNLRVDNIYPNPTNGILNVAFYSKNDENLNFTVRDAVGRELSNVSNKATVGNNLQTLNLNALPKGLYFVTISNGREITLTRRIIKN